jgi:hypothetical protein
VLREYGFVTGFLKQCIVDKLISDTLFYRCDYLNSHMNINSQNNRNWWADNLHSYAQRKNLQRR